MIVRSSFVALALLACAPAYGAADTRIRTEAYSPNQIVRILGKAGIQSTIEFADDERIENVAVGNSSAWQITPNHRASLLFVKPLTPRSRTNMTVVTDHRTYMFDLVAGDKCDNSALCAEVQLSATRSPPTLQSQWSRRRSRPRPRRLPDGHCREAALRLEHQGQREAASRASIRRRLGAVPFVESRCALPAILTMSEDRKEGPLNYRMDGDYIVIDPIPQNVVLRYGSRTAALWPSHRIPSPQPNAVAGRMAANPAPPAKVQCEPGACLDPDDKPGRVGTAGRNRSRHFGSSGSYRPSISDKLTDTAHDQ